MKSRRGNQSTLVDEKRTRFLKHLVEFFGGHFSDGMKNDVLFDSEKSLRTNKARLRKLAAFKIAAGERNRESVGMRATRDLAKNQIFTWQIGDANVNLQTILAARSRL